MFFSGISLTIALILFVVAPLLLLLAMLEVVEPPRWKVVFRLFGAAIASALYGCPCAASFFEFAAVLLLPAGLLATFLGALLTVALIDVHQRERRDVAHWLGVLSIATVVMHLFALGLLA